MFITEIMFSLTLDKFVSRIVAILVKMFLNYLGSSISQTGDFCNHYLVTVNVSH